MKNGFPLLSFSLPELYCLVKRGAGDEIGILLSHKVSYCRLVSPESLVNKFLSGNIPNANCFFFFGCKDIVKRVLK